MKLFLDFHFTVISQCKILRSDKKSEEVHIFGTNLVLELIMQHFMQEFVMWVALTITI